MNWFFSTSLMQAMICKLIFNCACISFRNNWYFYHKLWDDHVLVAMTSMYHYHYITVRSIIIARDVRFYPVILLKKISERWVYETCNVWKHTAMTVMPEYCTYICKIAHLCFEYRFYWKFARQRYTLSTCVDAKKYIFINDHCDNMESQLVTFVRFPSETEVTPFLPVWMPKIHLYQWSLWHMESELVTFVRFPSDAFKCNISSPMWMYSTTCLQGTPLYPRESVPTWQVSLRHRFLNMGKIGHHFEKVSPDQSVLSSQCPLKTGFTVLTNWQTCVKYLLMLHVPVRYIVIHIGIDLR